jgi:acyl carrier protein
MRTTYDIVVESIIEVTAMSVIDLEGNPKLSDLHLDSLDIVELMLELESQFNLVIDEKDLASCVTVEDIVKLIDKLRSE